MPELARRSLTLAAALICAGLVIAGALVAAPPAAAAGRVSIQVLGNRADLVSGGQALVDVTLPEGASPSELAADLDGRDVSAAFARRPNGRVQGLVSGLAAGANALTVRLPDGTGASLTITNHDVGGPIFAGEQVAPWPCATEENGLGPAEDDDCNAPPIHEYFYMSESSGEFEPYDPDAPPDDSDVATTTTDQGHTVDYVVRRERGVIDRGIYDIAVLYDPDQPWQPWAPQQAWNGKLHWPFGGSCQPWHGQVAPGARPDVGGAPGVLDDNALARGFAVASSGFSVLGSNCSTVVSAEALMMIKEHFVETYGPIRYTFGIGGSGGSIQQLQIAGAYPGLLDGIIPNATFADLLTTANENLDCRLLVHYFDVTSPHLGWTPAAKAAVEGHGSPSTCEAWISAYGFPVMLADPTLGCRTPLLTYIETDVTGTLRYGSEPDWVYDPDDNPGGVRCTIWDYMTPVFGTRAADGFAGRTFDNVGVMYGLEALRSGAILPEQFVDLNEKIGGLTIDYGFAPERTRADTGAVEAAYASGQVTSGGHLEQVPIVDGSYNPPAGDIHTAFHSWSVRARLLSANGRADNHVIRQAGGDRDAFDLMDDWLSRVEADDAPGALADKVARNRPDDAVDSGDYLGTNPRVAAGAPPADDVLVCRLMPLVRSDFADMALPFTDDQWARLQAAFPDGVCDWARPGVGQAPTTAWATYAAGDGPQALPAPPVSVPLSGGAPPPGGSLPATGGGASLLALGVLAAGWAVRAIPR